jgi:hypothetical protein
MFHFEKSEFEREHFVNFFMMTKIVGSDLYFAHGQIICANTRELLEPFVELDFVSVSDCLHCFRLHWDGIGGKVGGGEIPAKRIEC